MSTSSPQTVLSMTGFARTAGSATPFRWAWEVKTVNAKGLDLRLRLPPGTDSVEPAARALLGRRLGRGTCYANLTAERDASGPAVRLNTDLLGALVRALQSVPAGGSIGGASLDGLLAIPGVVEIAPREAVADALATVTEALLHGLDQAIDALLTMREAEGTALVAVIGQRLDGIDRGVTAAETLPSRAPHAVQARLAQSIAQLVGSSANLDPDRLHQEAVLLVAKADVREELDRLRTHAGAARAMLAAGGPVGRRLDFLAQEFAREANTLCAKANDIALTQIGLELKSEIEQFREQIQNLE